MPDTGNKWKSKLKCKSYGFPISVLFSDTKLFLVIHEPPNAHNEPKDKLRDSIA